MKLTILVDNNTFIDQYYFGEPAVSYYIEVDGKKILFDTGYSDIVLQNAKLMDIDLNEVESVILFTDWLTIPSSGKDHLIRDGFVYYPSTEAEENRLEGWIPVMEIPLG